MSSQIEPSESVNQNQEQSQSTDQDDRIVDKLMAKITPMITGAVKNHVAKQKQPDVSAMIQEALKSQPVEAKEKGSAEDLRIARLEAQLKQETDRRIQTERRAYETAAYQAVQGQLAGKVKSGAETVVADLLFKARKQIEIQDDGAAYFKTSDELNPYLSIEEGVAAFLATKEAELFIPAPRALDNTRGSRMPASNNLNRFNLSADEELERKLRAHGSSF